jgi:hypothetical protein
VRRWAGCCSGAPHPLTLPSPPRAGEREHAVLEHHDAVTLFCARRRGAILRQEDQPDHVSPPRAGERVPKGSVESRTIPLIRARGRGNMPCWSTTMRSPSQPRAGEREKPEERDPRFSALSPASRERHKVCLAEGNSDVETWPIGRMRGIGSHASSLRERAEQCPAGRQRMEYVLSPPILWRQAGKAGSTLGRPLGRALTRAASALRP